MRFIEITMDLTEADIKTFPNMEFSESMDKERLALHKKANALSEKQGISYRDAIYKILKEEQS